MTSNEKELAGDTNRVLMGTNMVHSDDRMSKMRKMFPTLSDNTLSRAPKRFLLPTRLRTNNKSLMGVTPTQLEKLDQESLRRKQEEEGRTEKQGINHAS